MSLCFILIHNIIITTDHHKAIARGRSDPVQWTSRLRGLRINVLEHGLRRVLLRPGKWTSDSQVRIIKFN